MITLAESEEYTIKGKATHLTGTLSNNFKNQPFTTDAQQQQLSTMYKLPAATHPLEANTAAPGAGSKSSEQRALQQRMGCEPQRSMQKTPASASGGNSPSTSRGQRALAAGVVNESRRPAVRVGAGSLRRPSDGKYPMANLPMKSSGVISGVPAKWQR
eukprot:g36259.t1